MFLKNAGGMALTAVAMPTKLSAVSGRVHGRMNLCQHVCVLQFSETFANLLGHAETQLSKVCVCVCLFVCVCVSLNY